MLQDEIEQQRDRIYPAALICSVLANVNRDPESRREPWQPADFMPGAKSEEEEWMEFIDAMQSGEKFEADPEEVARFKQQMQEAFGKRTDEETGITRGNLISTERTEHAGH